jgi:hypothetical protein
VRDQIDIDFDSFSEIEERAFTQSPELCSLYPAELPKLPVAAHTAPLLGSKAAESVLMQSSAATKSVLMQPWKCGGGGSILRSGPAERCTLGGESESGAVVTHGPGSLLSGLALARNGCTARIAQVFRLSYLRLRRLFGTP